MVRTENLVIVESPSKCKTIEGYLGDKYKVIATCGHFRSLTDLSQIKDDLDIKFSVSKPKILKMLKEEILMSKNVILATDNDREGESIAWHICDACKLPLTTQRIIFHEITKDAIQRAILSPTIIDMNKVNSQKCRQVLDLYIGFTISPILWKYIQHKLSAGRCQTPALKMLYEREQLIKNQNYETTYKVTGIFNTIEFKLVGNLDKVIPFLEACKIQNQTGGGFIVEKQKPNEVSYSPPSILITSTLQQRASNIGMSPKQTMMCAQTLYEHGLITYMRTETPAYSTTFIEKINKQICLQYGKEYMGNPCSNVDTHEGIRVTDIKIDSVDFDSNTNKLYHFIYNHTFQSCMSTAFYIQTPYDISMPYDRIMRHVSSYPKFKGWKILKDFTDIDLIDQSSGLDFMKKVNYSNISAKEQCEHLILHYNEAQLIKQLEKEDIGRPSTYTSILDSIEKYVTKGRIETNQLSLVHYVLNDDIRIEKENKCIEEKNKLKLTELGEKVTLFCYKYFDLFEYSYTKQMELFLDNVSNTSNISNVSNVSNISNESNDWKVILNNQIKKIKECSSYEIDEIKPEYKSLHCGLYKKHPLVIKDGPHGYYIDYKKEKTSLKHIEGISEWIKDQEMNEERMNVLINYMKNDTNNKNVINNDISIRKSKDDKGYYIFYKTSKMKKPKFYSFPNELMNETDYINKIKDYIEKKYKLI
jgi:DNA topoisomerase-1